MIRRVAPTRTTVLIRGESGTGKEVIARAIHLLSSLARKLFVTLDCTNIPNNLMESELFGHERGAFTDARSRKIGLLESASGGTLFLDEIGLMSVDLQAKLLNVLETQRFRRVGGTEEIEVAVRVLAATNEDLEKAVHEGRFREDLYYRLNVVPVDIPPLRDRGNDVLLIADHYLQQYTSLHGVPPRQLSEEARALMLAYPWPGNVRELKNTIERVVLMTDTRIIPASALSIDRRSRRARDEAQGSVLSIDPEGQMSVDLPPDGLALEEVERQFIQAALVHTGGNVTRAAELLRISRDTLRYRIAKFAIE
jgi:DNA-binding NtrC family response regulator